MPEQELLHYFLFTLAGFVLGIITVLLVNKLRSGSASPVKIKREMEQYQADVESHFDETSEKFKQMAVQYQDLYKHLSVGATTLCRPEHIVPGLSDARDPLATIEKKPAQADEKKPAQAEPKPVKADAQVKAPQKEKLQPKQAEVKKPDAQVKSAATEKKPVASKEPAKSTTNKKT